MIFRVMRHGGNSNHKWRQVGKDLTDLVRAQERFDHIKYKQDMRQGGLKLVSNDGATEQELMYYSAPRLRTRW
jgi:hypothetical protein